MSRLPLTCAHGNYWPKLCAECHQQTTASPPKPKPKKSTRPRRNWAAYAEQPAIELDDEQQAFASWVEARYPSLSPAERAVRYLKDPEAKKDWERFNHERTNQPLF